MNDAEMRKMFEEALYRSHSALSKTYSNQQGEILQKIGELSGKIDGIHQRQDIANGRTAKNEIAIQALREGDIKLADLVSNHIIWEEKREAEAKEERKTIDNNATWWKRNLGWYIFLAIMGVLFLILKKENIINI